jgi:predicted nuclease with TOPRIM domain
MMALLLLLLLCCCTSQSTAFVRPGMRSLRRFQSVQRFRGGIARSAERDDDIADLKTRTTVLETKNVAVETAFDRLERTIKEQGLQMITKMDKMETKMDKMETKMDKMETKMDKMETKIDMNFKEFDIKIDMKFKEFDIKIDKINSDIKFIPLLNAAVLIGVMMVLANAFGCDYTPVVRSI